MRRFRWLLLLVVALVVAAAVAAVLFVRPDIADARDRVDARWIPVRPSLIARYDALGGMADALNAAGAADRAVTNDLEAELERWDRYAFRGPRHTDPGAEATSANALEALARHVRVNIAASARLLASQPLRDALTAFDQAVVAPATVAAYNRAVRSYEDARSGFPDSLVASLLGYEARPVLVIGT